MVGACQIRAAQTNDGAEIIGMLRRLAEHEGAAHPPLLTQESLHHYVFSDTPRVRVLVAEENGALVGFVLFFETFSSWAGGPAVHIGDLWVEEHARKRDIGRRLLQEALSVFPERRADVYVIRGNKARSFYERCRFVEQEEWVLYRKTP